MPDPRAVTRVVDELVWSLRRTGLVIATSQAIDVVRAVAAVGLGDAWAVREAVASVVVHDARERGRFDAAFEAFFRPGASRKTLWERLLALGFVDAELTPLRELLADMAAQTGDTGGFAALLERGADLDRMLQLAGVVRTLDGMRTQLQAGFYTHRVLEQLGVPRSYNALAAIRAALTDALGERGVALADALRAELDRAADDVRAHVRATFARREKELLAQAAERNVDTKDFAVLSDAEIEEVRRSVRVFVERLRGSEHVRARRARRGRFDIHRTVRRALRTQGVPFAPARKALRRSKARLMLLCDVSDSVRTVARFTLELTYAAQELFDRTRSFVFVSELGETTALFEKEPISVALGVAYGGGVVSIADNSNYGRVLRAFEARYLAEVDRRTTVVILGDGRTNYHEDSAEVLDRIRERAGALLWLCPESRGDYATGDSAMSRYAPRCTQVLEVRTARDLEDAARAILTRR